MKDLDEISPGELKSVNPKTKLRSKILGLRNAVLGNVECNNSNTETIYNMYAYLF